MVGDDRSGGAEVGRAAVAGHAEAADELAIFVKRHAAGRVVERGQRHRTAAHARGNLPRLRIARRVFGRAQIERIETGRDRLEAVHVGVKKIRETDADERARRRAAHARRKMLLDDETRRPRGERILIAAQKRGRARARNRPRDHARRRHRAGLHAPHAEHESLAIDHGDHRARIGLRGVGDGLREDALDIGLAELLGGPQPRGKAQQQREDS